MDTDSLYLALAENNIRDCIKQDMVEKRAFIRRGDCTDEFEADSLGNFFLEIAVLLTRSLINGNGLFKWFCCYNSDDTGYFFEIIVLESFLTFAG